MRLENAMPNVFPTSPERRRWAFWPIAGAPGWSSSAWVRTAAIVWALIIVAVCVRAAVQPYKRTLYTTWTQAGSDWEQGHDLYRQFWEPDQDQFRYSPLTAVLFVPFHHLPIRLGGVAWRILNAAVLLGGFALWLRAAPLARTPRQQAILFLLLAPLSLSSLNNGQPNPLIIGLLLAALAAVDGERWSLAAALVALTTAVKVYPLAIGLLLAAVYPRRFAPRLLLALALAAVLPFACQHWDYVHAQYVQWLQRLDKDHRWDWPLHMAYRDLWLLIRLFHVPMSPRGYLVVQLLSAAACAALCLALRLRGSLRRDVLAAILVLGTSWMTLCGPATESSTYVLLAPTLAWMVQRAESERWPRLLGLMTRMAFILFLFCVVRGLWSGINRIHALGLQPQAALLLCLAYVMVLMRELSASGQSCRARCQRA
ncbi:MAG TPA: glycosyltransferase 87 family protein [Gemmataceae bacterium]|nr:glycosyltransferase 87 family protein [Gemmataceae bacterium]